jgi:hypothetical protein
VYTPLSPFTLLNNLLESYLIDNILIEVKSQLSLSIDVPCGFIEEVILLTTSVLGLSGKS